MKRFVCLLALIVFSSASMARADECHLRNGDRLTGELVRMADGVLVLKTAYAGEINLPWVEIVSFTGETKLPVLLKSGETVQAVVLLQNGQVAFQNVDGEAGPVAKADIVAINVIVEATPKEEEIEEAVTEPKEKPKWEGSLALSLGTQQGNVDTQNARINGTAERRTERDLWKLYFKYADTEDNNEVTARSLKSGAKYELFFDGRDYGFAKLDFEQDRFKDLKLRSSFGLGYGYQLVDREHWQVKTELGFGYVNEDFDDGDDENFFSTILSQTLDWQISDDTELSQSLEYVPSVEDFTNATINFDVSLETRLSKRWSLQATYELEYDNQPSEVDPGEEEIKHSDHSLFVSLVFKF